MTKEKYEGLKYSKNHEWIKITEKIGYIGISNFAQKELGDIVYLDIDNNLLHKLLDKDESFGSIEAVKTVSDLFMPISGKIIEFNDNLLSNPELINKDSYKYWILKIEITDFKKFKKEFISLMSLELYKKYITSKN